MFWPCEDVRRQYEAHKALEAIGDLVTLNAWIDRWLSEDRRKRLHNALRAARKRERDSRQEKPKTVTLTRQAWMILSDLARRDKVTLSEVIERRLEREWLKGE